MVYMHEMQTSEVRESLLAVVSLCLGIGVHM